MHELRNLFDDNKLFEGLIIVDKRLRDEWLTT
jgi:hypothetical protein